MPVVRIEPMGFEANLVTGEPVLSGLFRCGFTACRVGCRRGGCGICKIDLLEGEVTYEKAVADTVLTLGDRAEGKCLACRAIPVDDITLWLGDAGMSSAPLGLLRYLNAAEGPIAQPESLPPASSCGGPGRGAASTKEK